MIAAMEDVRVGSAFRAVRIRRGWSQESVAQRAGVSRSTVSRLECGHVASLPVATLRRVAGVLGMGLDLTPRWRGADMERMLHAAHNALHETMARQFQALTEWVAVPEASFSIYGERGIIDLLAWHERTRSMLIIELKTLLVDPGDLAGTMDRRVRLGKRIALDRGWSPEGISSWVVFSDTRTNRRHLADHETMLRAAFPSDGRQMRRWLESPSAPIAGLSFVSDAHAVIARRVASRPRRSGRAHLVDAAGDPLPDP